MSIEIFYREPGKMGMAPYARKSNCVVRFAHDRNLLT